MLPDSGRRVRFALAPVAFALACAPRVRPPSPAAPVAAEPELEGEPVAFRGYVGRSLVAAELVASSGRFQGCYRELGATAWQRIDGALGEAMTDVAPSVDESDSAPDAEPEPGPERFDCRLDVRSDIARLGSFAGQCVALDDPASSRAAWQLDGTFFSVKGGEGIPFFLGPATYAGMPDELLLALARAEPGSHACAPFIDALDVKTLPGKREAVLYARDFPCEHPRAEQGEESVPLEPPALRLALFAQADPAHPRVVVVPGNDDYDELTLAAYELSPGVEVFEIKGEHHYEAPVRGTSGNEESRSLFALTRSGRAGPLLDLPVLGSEHVCDPFTDLNLLRVELDGEPPAELVVELDFDPQPCTEGGDGPPPPPTPHTFTDTAYGFEPERARFVPLSVETPEIRRRTLTPLEQVAKEDETWRTRHTESACRALHDGSAAAPVKP